MQGTSNKPFYIQWLFTAFSHACNISDLFGGVLGVVLYFVYEYWGTEKIDISFWIITGGLGGIVLLRLLLAPYWIYMEQKKTIMTLYEQSQADVTQQLFVIEVFEYEFGTSGEKGYPESQNRRILKLDFVVHTTPSLFVKDVKLHLDKYSLDSGWQSDYVSGGVPTGGFYYINIPDSIKPGDYTVYLEAFSEDKKAKSKPLVIRIPE